LGAHCIRAARRKKGSFQQKNTKKNRTGFPVRQAFHTLFFLMLASLNRKHRIGQVFAHTPTVAR
jgi:hypothetical protein